MTDLAHREFVEAYREGRVQVRVDRGRAADFVAARLLLAFVLLPLLGAAVALALIGFLAAGAALLGAALLARHLVRASSQGYVLSRSLHAAQFYRDALAARVLQVEPTGDG